MDSIILACLRTIILGGKFLFSLFLGSVAGFELVGYFGLVSAACVVVPLFIGMNYRSILSRMAATEDIRRVANTFMQASWVPVMAYLVFMLGAGFMGGDRWFVLAVGLILVEHLNDDVGAILIGLRRNLSAQVLLGVRTVLWMGALAALVSTAEWDASIAAICALWLAASIVALVIGLLHSGLLAEFSWSARPDCGWYWSNAGDLLRMGVWSWSQVGALYIDRIALSFVSDMASVGVFVLFWQVGNAVSNVVEASVVARYRATLMKMATSGDSEGFRVTAERAFWEGLGMVCFSCLGAAVVVYFGVPLLGLTDAAEAMPLLWLMLGLAVLRQVYIWAGELLFAAGGDELLALSGISAIAVMAVFCTIGAAGFELYGAAIGSLLSMAANITIRLCLMRRFCREKSLALPRILL